MLLAPYVAACGFKANGYRWMIDRPVRFWGSGSPIYFEECLKKWVNYNISPALQKLSTLGLSFPMNSQQFCLDRMTSTKPKVVSIKVSGKRKTLQMTQDFRSWNSLSPRMDQHGSTQCQQPQHRQPFLLVPLGLTRKNQSFRLSRLRYEYDRRNSLVHDPFSPKSLKAIPFFQATIAGMSPTVFKFHWFPTKITGLGSQSILRLHFHWGTPSPNSFTLQQLRSVDNLITSYTLTHQML